MLRGSFTQPQLNDENPGKPGPEFEGVAEPPNTMILVTVFKDSINYLQVLVQIMYIAPTTVHQCSASKLESFALHGSTNPRRSAKEDAE